MSGRMFTGIVESVGTIAGCEPHDEDVRLIIDCQGLDLSDAACGESIAINGVCLTVVDLDGPRFSVDVSKETLSCTTFDSLRPGDRVNLERALLPTTRLGGHLVSGHVDGVGRVVDQYDDGRSQRLRFAVAENLQRYIARKGSVCIDGVSLTVNAVDGCQFDVNIIPHTMAATIIKGYVPGTVVNIEVDVLARYVEQLLAGQPAAPASA